MDDLLLQFFTPTSVIQDLMDRWFIVTIVHKVIIHIRKLQLKDINYGLQMMQSQ